MTEVEWLTTTDVAALLGALYKARSSIRPLGQEGSFRPITDRKLRLWATACIVPSGCAAYSEEKAATANLDIFVGHMLLCCSEQSKTQVGATKAALLRDIAGNPWKPVTLADPVEWMGFPPGPHYKLPRSWLTPPVLALARDAYESRDFSALPVLWDALSEAGCQEEQIRWHCAEPLHVRGCWLIDLLLGKD